jgi:hypothetical protein
MSRPRLFTVDKVQSNKRVKNLRLGLHREVAIARHMGQLCKRAQPTRTTNINLLLQASLGIDDASQILEILHQLQRATADGGVNKQLGHTLAH